MPLPPIRTAILADGPSFVHCWDKIDRLRSALGQKDDVLVDPLHFLAGTDDTRRSCTVASWADDELVGVLYATEHWVFGVRSGYAIGGDYAGRGVLLCRPEFETSVLTASITHLFSAGVHSLHLRLVPQDLAEPEIKGIDVKCLDATIPGDTMKLPPTFDEFLASLGKHTRRNVRYYTRRACQEGIEFAPSVEAAEYYAAIDELRSSGIFQAKSASVARYERMLAYHSTTRRYGLRASDGRLVSVLCGFTRGRRFYVLTQVNDTRLAHLSLSTVMRGYIINDLIVSGYSDLQFVGGTSLSLGRFCVPQRYRSIFADKKGGIHAAIKQLGSKIVNVTERNGKPAPQALKIICNGHLEPKKLIERTAIAPAQLAFAQQKAS